MTDLPNLDRGRFRGALLGLAVGDAVGTTVEFKPPGTFERVTDMIGGGPFGLPPGAWTDDTSMALCLAESLIERRGFDPVDQLERYLRWYREGHWSSTGRCFDIGNATRQALQRFERTREPYPGDADRRAAGNGPLMKLAPVALAYAAHPVEAVHCAGLSARTTHGAPEAVDASRYFAALLVGALGGAPVSQLLDGVFEPVAGAWRREPLHPKVEAVAAGSFQVEEPPAIRGGGYIVDALEAALWALRSTRTFEDGVLAAVNLGDDADTTAAIFGQLAGALYGVDAIPQRWRERVVMRDEIIAFADALYELAQAIQPARSASGATQPPPTASESPVLPAPGDSYWVIPGRLLAGPYPGAPSKSAAQAKLDAFLDAGVTCFVDLTEEGEGPPLHPYAALLRTRAAKRGFRVTHLRMPIRDVDIPTSWQMRAILSAIRLALEEGETVYVHCWGGVGRTGTVVGCLLVEDGTPSTEVLGRLAQMRVHTERAPRVSPETDAQRKFVTTWKATPETLTLDQEALAHLRPEPVVQDGVPIPTLGEIVAKLRAGSPVVIEGPRAGWCVQAVADRDDQLVRVEVLDPEHWESGAPLPPEQQRTLEQLGLERESGAWARTDADENGAAVIVAANLMLDVVRRAWGLCPVGALRRDDVPAPDAEWERIAEFAHTFDGYAHFGEHWGERFNVVRERFLETGELPAEVDDLRACLFLEFRADRFTWGDDVTLSEPDAEGVRHVIPNPDLESSPTQRYRRAIIEQLRRLLDDGGHSASGAS